MDALSSTYHDLLVHRIDKLEARVAALEKPIEERERRKYEKAMAKYRKQLDEYYDADIQCAGDSGPIHPLKLHPEWERFVKK